MEVFNEVSVNVYNDGIFEASVKGSSIHAFCFPRDKRNTIEIKNTLSGKIGVYLLIGRNKPPSAKLEVYIGHADNVESRLNTHDSRKMIRGDDNWFDTVVVYDSKEQMTIRDARAVEKNLIKSSARNFRWDTRNKRGVKKVSSEESNNEGKYVSETVLVARDLTRILGFDVFRIFDQDLQNVESISEKGNPPPDCQEDVFIYRVKDVMARMMASESGSIIVLKGSQANSATTESTLEHIKSFREELIRKKILRPKGDKLVFSKNQEFLNVSKAGAVIAGYGVNGNTVWKLSDGTTYGDWIKKNRKI